MLLCQALMSLSVKVLRLICHSCTAYHLVLALIEQKDIVSIVIPGFNVAVCQGIRLICHNSTTDHQVSALIEHKDIVDAVIPGFDVTVCQGI